MLKRILLVVGLICCSSALLAEAPEIRAIFPSAGSIGDKVCIIGDNFSEICEDNTVGFGGEEAEILKCTPFSIIVTAPEGLELGDCDCMTADNIEILPQSLPHLSGINTCPFFQQTSFNRRMDND